MEWRNEILEGIDVLPKYGLPGTVVVYKDNADPILTGTNREDILVAAAELGNGRIVAIAHSDYGDHFLEVHQGTGNVDQSMQIFSNNLTTWLTRGTFEKGDRIIDAYQEEEVSTEELKSSKIVVWHGGNDIKISPDELAAYVRDGGALLHCCVPWGYLQLNKGNSISDIPCMNLLNEGGLCYTDEYIYGNSDGFEVKNNKADEANLSRILQNVDENPSSLANEFQMIRKLKFVPENGGPNATNILRKLYEFYDQEIKKGNVPSEEHPVSDKTGQVSLQLWLLLVEILDLKNVKGPGVEIFPGDFTTAPTLKSNEIEVQSMLEDFYPTFCYLPAGEILKLEVVSGNEDKDWQVLIGPHTDELDRLDDDEELRRWPKISKRVRLSDTVHEISSPFGSLIYLISSGKPNSHIKIRLDNIVDSPCFKLTDGENGRMGWNDSRYSAGLWADIVGEYITITFPSSSVRELEFGDLTQTMTSWDNLIKAYHDLRGTDVTKHRRQWIVADQQPSVGYMHSGYPIVTHLDVADPNNNGFLLNGEKLLTEGFWGAFHEIGHNMQRDEWTFEGTGEVTCNIFTLWGMETICNIKPWIHNFLQGKNMEDTEKYLKDGADFQVWKGNAGVALFFYAQLIHEFGWESFKKVFRVYEAKPGDERPNDNQTKIDTWFSVFSEVVRFNLTPMAKFWGIEISAEMATQLGTAFPVAFLPDDEVTQFVPDRVADLLQQFPGLVRKQ